MSKSKMVELAEPSWCDKCHAHVIPMGLGEYLWSWACWHITMHWPHRFFMSRPHAAILPWSGNIAYRCVCIRNQRFALRASASSEGSHGK